MAAFYMELRDASFFPEYLGDVMMFCSFFGENLRKNCRKRQKRAESITLLRNFVIKLTSSSDEGGLLLFDLFAEALHVGSSKIRFLRRKTMRFRRKIDPFLGCIFDPFSQRKRPFQALLGPD